MNKSKTKNNTFEEYKKNFSNELMETYGIEINDCITEKNLKKSWNDGETVEELIKWLGEKFLLINIKDIKIY